MSSAPLIDAINASDPARVVALLDSGHDVHARGDQEWPALCFAAGRGDREIVRLLIARGADVFLTGADGRTPYQIAMAASHLAVASDLRQREEEAGGDERRVSSREWETRPYCRAYRLDELRQYPHWRTVADDEGARDGDAGTSPSGNGEAGSDDDLVFVHQDYAVTRTIWRDTAVLYAGDSPAWRLFCTDRLGFRVPRDLDDPVAAAGA